MVIRLKRLFYDFNEAQFRPTAREELNKIVQLLISDPAMRIEIASHTDNRGTATYNQQLSQQRAEKIVQYLVSQNIDRFRLEPKGYGATTPLIDCYYDSAVCSEVDHQYNRRTEIKILSASKKIEVAQLDNVPERISSPNTQRNRQKRKYYVIAGSFAQKENAVKRLSSLQEKGFYQAKLVKGNAPAVNVVLVEAFPNQAAAAEFAAELEVVHAIHSYVRRGR